MSKAGFKNDIFAISAHLPNFKKLAIRAGVTEEAVGGQDSSLVNKREGGEIEPRSIGAIGQVWAIWLRYAQAMMSVTMPDGSVYGVEAGFVILDRCYFEYASQRKTVACVCSALTEGWRKFTDELVTSNDDFLTICKNQLKAGVWLETGETLKRKGDDVENAEAKRLKAELAKEKARAAQLQQQVNSPYRRQDNGEWKPPLRLPPAWGMYRLCTIGL